MFQQQKAFFSPLNSPNTKVIQFSVMQTEENQQIHILQSSAIKFNIYMGNDHQWSYAVCFDEDFWQSPPFFFSLYEMIILANGLSSA